MFSNQDMKVLGENNPHLPKPNDQAFKRWISREFSRMEGMNVRRFYELNDKVIYLRMSLDEIPNLQPYMRELVTNAAHRIFKYRYTPNLLSFSHNEVIMISRLYEAVR